MPRFDEPNYPYAPSIVEPAHYVENRKYEPALVIIDWQLPYCLGNALKYISRAGKKGDSKEDLRKAMWYLNREISKETHE